MLNCFKKGDRANDTVKWYRFVPFAEVVLQLLWLFAIGLRDLELAILKNEGRSSAATNMNLIKTMLVENPRYTMHEIINATNIPKTTIHNLIRMGYVNQNLIPHLLTETSLMNRIYVRFSSRMIWKRFFFKEACHWRRNLDFVSNCDFQLSRSLNFA